MPIGLLATVAIALAGAAGLAFVYRADPRRAVLWTLLPLLFAAGLGVAWWAWPVSPLVAGFVWLPVVTGALTIVLLMVAVSTAGTRRSPTEQPLRGARHAARLLVGFLVAALGVTLAVTFV
jgi:hypothetical protein